MGKQFEITLNSALVFVQVNQAAKQEDGPVSFPFPPLNAALPPSSRPSLQPWVTCETVPSSLTNTLSLSGLKSLVIMLPGSTTRDCCGSSVLQNAWRKASSSGGSLEAGTRDPAYRFGRRPLAERLAGQLAGPLLRLVAAHVVGGHSGNDERHVGRLLLGLNTSCCGNTLQCSFGLLRNSLHGRTLGVGTRAALN